MSFQLIAAHYGQLLLGELRSEAGRGRGVADEAAVSIRAAELLGQESSTKPTMPDHEVEPTGGEAVGSGWLFIPPVTLEPKSWLVFRELGTDRRGRVLFEWSRRLGNDLGEAVFVVECFRCFLGRDVDPAAVREVVSRLHFGRTRRRDVIRFLMTFEDATPRGRFLVFAEPSPWLTAIAPTGSEDTAWSRLWFNA